ncbi:MAG: hypothetical protein KBF80_00120 [Flavobacteriales bacterium]|nr:hypothetical protein [Flavobacteriales bacterium]
MHRGSKSMFPAWLLLAVMLFSTVPRTLFHHCTGGLVDRGLVERTGGVHANAHCPACEAPVPIGYGPVVLHVAVKEPVGVLEFVATFASVVRLPLEAPHQRGPPALP